MRNNDMSIYQNYFLHGDKPNAWTIVRYLDNDFVDVISLSGPMSASAALLLVYQLNNLDSNWYDGWTERLMREKDLYKEKKSIISR